MGPTTSLLMSFLQEELAIPTNDITLAWKQSGYIASLLPIVLWQYGLITLTQLDRIFDWLQDFQSSADMQSVYRAIDL